MIIEDNSGLDLYVDYESCGCEQVKNFLHSRNLHALIGAVPGTEIQSAQLVKCVVFEPACSVTGAVNGLVVADDDHAVFGLLDVEFDAVGAHVGGHLKSGQCILGGVSAGSPVSPDQRVISCIHVLCLSSVFDVMVNCGDVHPDVFRCATN